MWMEFSGAQHPPKRRLVVLVPSRSFFRAMKVNFDAIRNQAREALIYSELPSDPGMGCTWCAVVGGDPVAEAFDFCVACRFKAGGLYSAFP